ncbi:MAG: HDOD domain-containing protein [Thermodesulfobacteriota bacterium]|nr:HDOD domain-containing protein [Thermodesulfobacteriota bacterium]
MTTKTIIIPSGGAEITSSDRLKACLGSCVGVALYDPKVHLGGLAHLLLPEPTFHIQDSDRSYYASTGLDLLVSMMEDRGASRNRMEATIAGGALITPLCPADIRLNIGGKTLEIASDKIRKHGIHIKNIEASGHTPRNISLNTSTGECIIEPMFFTHTVPDPQVKKPSIDEITRFMEGILPIPQTTLKIAQMLSSKDWNTSGITQELKKDQVLTARVLRLCNSSFVNPIKEITSIEQAMPLLGNRILLKMVISAQLEQFMGEVISGYSLCRGGMFYHATGTADLSERFSVMSKISRPDIAYTAGLLHDIGKVVLDQYISEIRPLFYRRLKHGTDSSVIENEILGINHTRAGDLLAQSWNLPDMIREVITCHHYPEMAHKHHRLVYLVYTADLLINKFAPGLEIEEMDSSFFPKSLEILGISPSQAYEALFQTASTIYS